MKCRYVTRLIVSNVVFFLICLQIHTEDNSNTSTFGKYILLSSIAHFS